jgi:photosynthetic reaction center cytochrome c subunit
MSRVITIVKLLGAATLAGALLGCERPPVEATQIGFRGVAMEQVTNPRLTARVPALNLAPESLPAADPSGPRASEAYQNVQVLGDLSVGEFARVMAAITTWVAPNEGCVYCHKGEDLAVDDVYTKVVARKMLQMTRQINSNWQAHVGATGVTCYTCHRGQHIPANVWFHEAPRTARPMMAGNAGQNLAAVSAAYSSLPSDPFTTYLSANPQSIRVQAQAVSAGAGANVKDTERSYALMMHLSQSLGVNCTFCHNSRAFGNWTQSNPQRITAWHGIQMVRDANVNYVTPTTDVFPANRKGPMGDIGKVYCSTCHNGQNKPLNGVSMYKDYPELGAPRPPPPPTEEEAAAAAEAGAAAEAAP